METAEALFAVGLGGLLALVLAQPRVHVTKMSATEDVETAERPETIDAQRAEFKAAGVEPPPIEGERQATSALVRRLRGIYNTSTTPESQTVGEMATVPPSKKFFPEDNYMMS
jgi:hypothetical protein